MAGLWEKHILAERKNSLHGNVHDHHSLCTEMEWQDLQSVGDQKARETDVVEDAKQPDENQLSIARVLVSLMGVLVDGTSDSPQDEREDHSKC